MRLNLGCGSKKMPGWVNVDKVGASKPDQVVDLEVFPWPWPDSSVDEILLAHVLEHLGASPEVYLGLIKEMYRVSRPGASIKIVVPHPRHDDFLGDPTHVRAITPQGLELFSQKANREWIAGGMANTPLGIYHGVDFTIVSVNYALDALWLQKQQRGEVTRDDLNFAAHHYNNVVKQTMIDLKVVKPAGSNT